MVLQIISWKITHLVANNLSEYLESGGQN